ncbi:OmpA family protein [Pseudomonas luteola]|uniref:phosphate ABC transporter substrate-binding/OmpA family protein n=1 Tax=Pseudomonas luteola TaxID=47886 RepID=UPI003890942E
MNSARQDSIRWSRLLAGALLGIVCTVSSWSTVAQPLPLRTDGKPVLSIHGSNTIGAQLSPLMVEGFLKTHGFETINSRTGSHENERIIIGRRANGDQVRIDMAAHGSSTGFADLIHGDTDIAAASRPIKDSEALELKRLGNARDAGSEHVIGIDGIAIILNAANPLTTLSTDELARLFSGDVKNWKDIGGSLGPVHLYARDDQSGTFDTFKELVMSSHGKSLSPTATRFESNDELSDAISQDPYGIGFVGLAAVGKVKAVSISDGSALALPPTVTTVATEDYPLSRRLFLYNKPDEKNPWVNAFIRYAQSSEGQRWVSKSGFVAQEVLAVQPAVPADAPAFYRQLADHAQRLSVNFRFAEGSATLDNKANLDIERLMTYLRENDKLDKKVALIGFSDTKEDLKRAELLSKLRAMAVRRELNKGGVMFHDIVGLGDALPVAANSDEGRMKNRRVEVWVY